MKKKRFWLTLIINIPIQIFFKTLNFRYGMIGRNGIGKTCLLSAIARGEFEKMTRHL
jgi:ATPase subunit of ABC transporter with duplicated ATPase domains